MFNLNRFKAHLKAEIREIKRFFNRKPKPFEQESLKLDAPKPKTLSRVKRLRQFQTDHSQSATTHRLRIAGKEKTRYELRHLVA